LFLLQTSMVTHNKTTVHRMAELQQTTATITTKGEGPRIAIWHAAISLFKEDPILGAGPASFSLRWNQFCPITLQVQAERAHSLWFQTAAEFGITGLILVLVPLLLLAKNIALNPFQKEQTAAAFGVLVMIIHDSIDYSFYTPLIGFIFVGLFTCSWTAETNQQTPRSVRCFLGAVSIGMILFTLCLTKQTYLLERSLQVQDNLDRIKLLTHATQWLPISDNVYYQLGKAWLNEKPPQVEKAKSAFQHAVTLNQYALEPSYALALTLSYQHNPACFQEIARMNALAPTSAKAAALTQLFYTSRGDTNKVAEWIRILDQRLKYKVSNGFPTDNSFSR